MSEFNRKIKQDIFVIMPFTSAPKREQKQLDSFFENNLKKAIEEHNEFENNYRVYRSNDTFNISNSIINSLASADIVICDLSGKFANPNVMYELGVRMTLSNKPVVLIREEHPDNKRIFDVAGYYTFQYDVLDYEQLKKHLIRKIRKFETGEEVYKSAVLQVLGSGKSVEGDDLARSLYVFRNLKTMVFSQLSFFVERFSRYVNQFIKVSISTTSDLPKIFLPPRRKKFENLDYSKFKWRFEYFHLVDHLMADNSLLSAIPFSLSSLVKKYLMAYQNNFNQDYHAFDKWTFEKAEMFILETFKLMSFLDQILKLLENPNLEEKEVIIKKAHETVKSSTFMDRYLFQYDSINQQ